MKRDRESVNNRRRAILSLLMEKREVKVDELAAAFGVSLMTIRRDLQYLEEQGQLSRFYGGAITEQGSPAPSAENDITDWQKLIGRYAASLVRDGEAIFINGSRVALGLLNYVTAEDVRVFTNNALASTRKLPFGVHVTLSGGGIQGVNGIMTGDCTMRNLLMEQADKAFIGCTGISPNGEVLFGTPAVLGINETMISHAYQYYILADHTRIGVVGNYASWQLEKMGTVITDELAPADVVEHLKFIGMTVIQVRRNDFQN